MCMSVSNVEISDDFANYSREIISYLITALFVNTLESKLLTFVKDEWW